MKKLFNMFKGAKTELKKTNWVTMETVNENVRFFLGLLITSFVIIVFYDGMIQNFIKYIISI